MEKISSAQVNRSRLRLKQFKEQFENTTLNGYINATKYPEQNVISEPVIERRKPSEIDTRRKERLRLQENEEIEQGADESVNHSADRLLSEVRPPIEIELPNISSALNPRLKLEQSGKEMVEVEPKSQIALKPKSQYNSEISANRTTGDKTFNSGILAKSQIGTVANL